MGKFDTTIQNIVNGLNNYTKKCGKQGYFIHRQYTTNSVIPAIKQLKIELFYHGVDKINLVTEVKLSDKIVTEQDELGVLRKLETEFVESLLDFITSSSYKELV